MRIQATGQRVGSLHLDFDGTLADSIPVMKRIFCAFLVSYDLTPSDFSFADYNGPPLMTILADIREKGGLSVSLSDCYTRYLDLVSRHVDEIVPAVGALDLLSRASMSGVPVHIVTSNDYEHVLAWLKRHGLARFVTYIVHGGLDLPGKPAPDPYLHSVAQLGVPRGVAIAVEDSLMGARSASDAGLLTYLLRSPGNGGCDYAVQIADLAGLEVE